MSNTAIAFEDFSVAFNGHEVLSHIHASIPAGGFTVFVGPNGAGKTTLLLCLLGEVRGKGRIHVARAVAEHIAYVPQLLTFDAQTPITVGEFLALGVSRRPLWLGAGRAARAVVDSALGRVGLEGAVRRALGDLSGGEMRRVLLASALLRSPRMLLLDEPSAGVDPSGETLFWDLLGAERRERGITIVMVSHNLPLTAHYATHVLCVHKGTCVEGAPHEVLTAHNLMEVFGIPIHLYPDQCAAPQFCCPHCGAFGPEEGAQALAACAQIGAGAVPLNGMCPPGCTHHHAVMAAPHLRLDAGQPGGEASRD